MSFSLHSPAFQNGGAIPDKYGRDGENRSPPLRWSDPPPEAKSFVLTVEDPNAHSGTFHHWGAHDLSPGQTDLREGAGNGEARAAHQGVNDFGDLGYDGPQPPPGDGPQHYHFRLAALNVTHLDLPERVDVFTILQKARRHIIAEAEIIGIY